MNSPTPFLLACLPFFLLACKAQEEPPSDSALGYDPGPFPEYCQQDWDADLEPSTLGELSGSYLGYYDLDVGTLDMMKFIPEHPFLLSSIRLAFEGSPGQALVRLTTTYGRSYPAIDCADGSPDGDLVDPIYLDVDDPDGDTWLEIDLGDQEVFLEPTQHYAVTAQQLEDGPSLAVESLPDGEYSRALLLIPGEEMPYGVDGNFRVEISGYYFCQWSDEQRWFHEDGDQPFADDASPRAAIADLNGDGHDDIVLNDGSPLAYMGDGAGGFSLPSQDPFPGAENASMLVFGDVDNDGDTDAFASVYVTADSDGDGVTLAEGDCNDSDATISPYSTERVSNGRDDDCDGIADDGTDTSDADGDGYSIAEGDCDDTEPHVFPGAREDPGNGRDDDCDGIADDGTDTSDADGDWYTIASGDCDDTNPDVAPWHSDYSDNGIDDDCDGVADDGTDTSDADGDGYGIAEGDCDDTRKEVYPGADEAWDALDNDCDGMADEDYTNLFLLNDGSGSFQVRSGSGVETVDPSTAAAFGDGNADGNLDLYWGNWLESYPDDPAVQDRYVQGNGDGSFTDATQQAGLITETALSCYGVLWNDYDNDGDQDIFVGNYHLYDNFLWQNQGDGSFRDVALEVGVAHDDEESPYSDWPGGHTYGGDFGDVDNDGDMDFYMANLAHPRVQPWSDPSMFVVNQGAPDFLFVNLLEEYGFIYDEGDVNAAFADYDNDMDLDLVVASLYTGHYSRLYRNDGGTGFTDVTYQTGTAVHDSVSAVWSDVDEDGDMDLFIADRADAPYVHLFVNQVGQEHNWLQLDLVGSSGNRDAVGARVTLEAGGVGQIRDVPGGGGHSNTQQTRIVHFGLADVATIDKVQVRWVGGATETISGLEPNHRYRVVEGEGTGEEVF